MYRPMVARFIVTLCALCFCIAPLDHVYKETFARKTQRIVYLTFDDGPSHVTDEVLNVLLLENVRGTFFVTGNVTQQNIYLYSRILDEGHALGLHSYSHKPYEVYRSLSNFKADFMRLNDWIIEHTGAQVKICRMVGGSNSRDCPAIVREEILSYLVDSGYACYDWDIDSKDSGRYALNPHQIAQNVISAAKKLPDRDLIVLLHDDAMRKTLPDALPIIIRYFQEQDYSFGVLREDTESIKRILPKKYSG